MDYTDANGKPDPEAKLKHAKKRFEDCVDNSIEAHVEGHKAARFYHNTDCEGQWESRDLQYLREAGRPAFSFNVIKGKGETFLGMYQDAQRAPVVAAANDRTLAAEVMNAIKEQLLQDAGYGELAADQLKIGSIDSECSIQVEVVPSSDGPGWIKLNLYLILPYEHRWDIASIRADRSDARYWFWDRWLDKDEFYTEYPDQVGQWDTLSTSQDPYSDAGFGDVQLNDQGEVSTDALGIVDSDYDSGVDRYSRYYYNRRRNKIRVIRYEYRCFKDVVYAIDTETRQKTEIDDAMRDRIETAQTLRLAGNIEIMEATEEKTEVCEFIGKKILAEYDEAGPFDGYSACPYSFDIDTETGSGYGFVRNLFDPQQEINKAKSLLTEELAQQTTGGVIAEKGAIVDSEQFGDEMRKPGGQAMVEMNALTEQRVIQRQQTPPNAAATMRFTDSMQLLNSISTIPDASDLTAAEHAQAGVTVKLRYDKARQSVSSPFGRHETAQKSVVEKVVQAVAKSMPDSQIEAILAEEGKYQIQGPHIIEMTEVEGPQGPQQVPKDRANIRDLRTLKWSIDMEHTSENSTLRMLELNVLLSIETAKPGSVDPEILMELASSSRSMRDRLKSFVEKQTQAASEGAQAQDAAMQQQSDQYAQLETGKAQETQRHNMATEQLTAQKQAAQAMLERMQIYIDADEAEKGRIMDVAMTLVQNSQYGGSYANA